MGHSEVWGPAGERLLIVGLTGGIASGKTEVDNELERLGALVIDADKVARDVVEPGAPAYIAIVREFGNGVLDGTGAIDRPALAAIVFNDEDKRRILNGITHPAIFQEMIQRVREYADTRRPQDVPAVVLDAALIVDTGVTGVFDLLVVITADEEARVRRLVETRGMSEQDARSRLHSQVDDARRVEMADLTIVNDGTIDELRARVSETWGEIARRAAQSYS
ncbi:MAG: dephospho-CoA kinase [Candidatus Geothermincolia bacterium]